MRLLVPLMLCSGCATTAFTVVKPARVAFDTEYQTVAVVDEARDGTGGQISRLRKSLDRSPRFEAVDRSDADLLVVLERQTVYSNVRVQKVEKDDEVRHKATRSTDVTQHWQVRTPDGDVLYRTTTHGSRRASRTADSAALARAQLPSESTQVAAAVRPAAGTVARRVAPWNSYVTRMWFTGGSEEMRVARKAVRADNWEAAADVWEAVAITAERDRLAAKARHNLAVAAERDGELERAKLLAMRASEDLGAAARTFERALDQRRRERSQLVQQGVE